MEVFRFEHKGVQPLRKQMLHWGGSVETNNDFAMSLVAVHKTNLIEHITSN